MKAYITELTCECSRALSLEYGDPPTLACDNPDCRHHGKTYRLPTVMLEEVRESPSDR